MPDLLLFEYHPIVASAPERFVGQTVGGSDGAWITGIKVPITYLDRHRATTTPHGDGAFLTGGESIVTTDGCDMEVDAVTWRRKPRPAPDLDSARQLAAFGIALGACVALLADFFRGRRL